MSHITRISTELRDARAVEESLKKLNWQHSHTSANQLTIQAVHPQTGRTMQVGVNLSTGEVMGGRDMSPGLLQEHLSPLLQQYSRQLVINYAKSEGYSYEEATTETGELVVEVHVQE